MMRGARTGTRAEIGLVLTQGDAGLQAFELSYDPAVNCTRGDCARRYDPR